MNDNMPPGVSPSSIPGNSPEDVAFELAVEELTNYEPEFAARVLRGVMPLFEAVEKDAYKEGYEAGMMRVQGEWEERSECISIAAQYASQILLELSKRNADDPLSENAWYAVKKIQKALEP